MKSLALVPPTLNNQSCFTVYDQARLLVHQDALDAYNTAQYWKLFNKMIAIEQIGNVDGDDEISIDDLTILIDYLLNGNASDINLDAADCNGDNSIDIDDVTTLISYILNGYWD